MKYLRPVLTTSFFLFTLFAIYPQKSKCQTNASSSNKELVKKIFNDLINKKNLEVIDKHFAEDAVDHSAWPDQAPGREGLKAAIKGLFDMFPDVKVEIQKIIAEGDFVVTRDFWTATDKNSGAKKSGWVLHMIKLKNGIITDEWSKGWEWMN
jgi:predicted SnoaL-like aldol condensation-catalyzing enzyme